MIELHQASKIFGRKTALHPLDLHLKQGDITGFLGPNGAGKSTTMRLMTGFLQPSTGTVRILGMDPGDSAHNVKQRLGYLPETPPLYSDMTAREYLHTCGLMRHLQGKALGRALDRVIASCHLKSALAQKIMTLSKGFKQRLGIAQALLHDPDIIILDEPTTGLDPNQTQEIRDTILACAQHKTLLYSTHMLQHVPLTCNRVVFLNNGRLVFDGTPRALAELDPIRTFQLQTNAGPDQLSKILGNIDPAIAFLTLEAGHTYELRGEALPSLAQLNAALEQAGLTLFTFAKQPASLERAFAHLTAMDT